MPSSPEQLTLADYIETFRRRMKVCVTAFSLVFGVALLVAIILPDVYRSSTEMRIDLEGPNVDLLEPLELTNYADQYISALQRRVITDDEISTWIEETGVYSKLRDEYTLLELVSLVREGIRIEMVTTTTMEPRSGRPVDLITGFTAAFDASEPQDSILIAEKLAAAFLDEDRKTRTERAAAASGFLREEIEAKRDSITQLEGKIADFKKEHAGSLPELMGLNMSVMERTERDIENIETEIRSLRQDKIFRETQLEEMRQQSNSAERLRQLEQEYLRAISVYGPDHPDVIRITRQVAALTGGEPGSSGEGEIQRTERELAAARQRYSEVHPDVVRLRRRLETLRLQNSTTPSGEDVNASYLQLRAQINALDTELAGLRERARTLRTKYDDTQDRIARMPEIERQFLALNRDLQTEQLAFNDLRSRLAQAQQTESYESGELGARLAKIRGAALPSEPVAPPRLVIVMFGGILAVTIALGTVILAEALDSSVRSNRDIRLLVNAPPIAEIPVINISAAAAHTRRQATTIVMVAMIISAAVLIVWLRT